MFFPKAKQTIFLKLSIHEPTLPMMRLRVEEPVTNRKGEVTDLKLHGDTLFTADETGALFENMFSGLLGEDSNTIFVLMRDDITEGMTKKRRNGFAELWEALTT